MLSKDKLSELMKVAMKEAVKKGDYPFASLLVDKNGTTIETGRNSQNTKDRTAHAEIVLMRKATKK